MSTLSNLIVLVIGNGGREHALVWLARKSPLVAKVLGWGPNAGILAEPKYESLGGKMPDFAGIVAAAKEHGVGLVLIGPEDPLAKGLADAFQEAGIPVLGPSAAAAELEGSKRFAKGVMEAAQVPTAKAYPWSSNRAASMLNALSNCRYPIVLKADGLAAGKGVTVCQTPVDAIGALARCWHTREFGDAGNLVLLEDFLQGHPDLIRSSPLRAEFSVLALVDHHGNFIMMSEAQDYKPVFDGDKGLNTGGMGAYAPIPWMTEEMMAQVGEVIFKPIIAEMKRRGIPFTGVLYAGLMWTAQGPKVVEFNVRFGDPELQPLVMLLKTDLIPILMAIANGESIAGVDLKWKSGATVCLVLASKGYPDKYRKNLDIYGPDQMPNEPDFKVFHAGTRWRQGRFIETTGGRVLNLVHRADSLEVAAARVRELAGEFSFGQRGKPGAGLHFRTDIGFGVPTSISLTS